MVDDQPQDGVQEILAANLRRLRIARHLSLSELARATSMSKATLSSIESGRSNPTVETLAALALSLRVSLAELLEEMPLGEIRIVRAARDHGGEARRVLDEVASSAGVVISELRLPPRQLHEAEPKPVGARAHLYILQGTLIAGPVERVTELAAGDYSSFPADVPHLYETGKHPARALELLER
jgi:transcriptional regulator with XRE-family HTH domain